VDFSKIAHRLTPDELELLRDSEAKGILHPQISEDLGNIQQAGGEAALMPKARLYQQIKDIVSSSVTWSDRMTRSEALLASYRLAKHVGMDAINRAWDFNLNWKNAPRKDPAAFAQFMVATTVGLSGDVNRMPILRGEIGRNVGFLKGYEIARLSNLNQNLRHMGPSGKVTAALMMGTLAMMGGLLAMPFVKDAASAIEAMWDIIDGVAPGLATELKEARDALLGEDTADILMHGPRWWGVDWSSVGFGDLISREMQSPGNLIPGAALVGPPLAIYHAYQRYESGQGTLAAARELMPNAVKHMMDALYPDLALTSVSGGSKLMGAQNYSTWDRALLGLGLQPAVKAEKIEHNAATRNQITAFKNNMTSIENRIANLTARGDTAGAQQALGDAMRLLAEGEQRGVYGHSVARQMRFDLRQKMQQRMNPDVPSRTQQRMDSLQHP
jgi:hypothetical protein